ncbi:MAG: glycosyltransferase [Acidobacteria bacterium]|nr:MAG: glycosyltransferase [Acidobacteriota bacterium]
MSNTRVAIVVPTLDEEEALRRLLPQILGVADELVVSDGGSRDGTVEVARELGVPVVSGSPGRGTQLNRGARETTAEALVFLHADTLLPPGAIEAVRGAVDAGRVGGGFMVRFDDPGPIYRFGTRMVALRTRLTRSPLGDQAQFVTRDVFEQLGGFHDWPILEDLDFIRRLKRLGELEIIPHQVVTSSRRYVEGGAVRTVILNWLIWVLYFAGVSPRRLSRLYKSHR